MPGRSSTRWTLIAVVAASLGCVPAAGAQAAGGASFPGDDGGQGGAQYGAPLKVAPPIASRFTISPGKLVSGTAPRIALRIDSGWYGTLRTRVVFSPVKGSDGHLLQLDLGRVKPGHLLRATWPKSAVLAAGRYTVLLHSSDAGGHPLRRTARRSGRASLTVTAAPKPPPVPVAASLTPISPVPPTTAGTFPVQGPHSYGDGFGAQRSGYMHQGVDVLAAEGTPVVAPVAGTVRFTDYQASAAGYYVVEYAADGRAFFFAHCQKDSVRVTPGMAVAQGAPICLVGHTGDATGPHLHFELWPTGWRDIHGTAPADAGPQLHAWDH
jgi:hypothetical protein